MTENITTVRMVRDATEFPESHNAIVDPENVQEFEANGWTVEVDGEAEKPADWKALHWKKRVALAKELGLTDADLSAQEADALLEKHFAAPAEEV